MVPIIGLDNSDLECDSLIDEERSGSSSKSGRGSRTFVSTQPERLVARVEEALEVKRGASQYTARFPRSALMMSRKYCELGAGAI